ncbi:MAG: hypothetical protein AAB375_01510 [Patescibacteria group bacterium]
MKSRAKSSRQEKAVFFDLFAIFDSDAAHEDRIFTDISEKLSEVIAPSEARSGKEGDGIPQKPIR